MRENEEKFLDKTFVQQFESRTEPFEIKLHTQSKILLNCAIKNIDSVGQGL